MCSSQGLLLLLVVWSKLLWTCLSASSCPLDIQNCVCEIYQGGHDFWCPDRFQPQYRLHFKPGQFWLECKSEFETNQNELFYKLQDVNLNMSLESLQISFCPIPDLSYLTITKAMNISHLKELNLFYGSFENIGELHSNQFQGLDELKALKLSRVPLKDISSDAFQGLAHLKSLRIVGNHLKSLRSDILKPLVSLEYLDLIEGGVQELPEDLFEAQKNLKHLEFSAQALTKILPNLFSNMTSLKNLKITRLDIEDPIPPDLFRTNSQLTNLTIVGRGLESAPSNFFENTNLESFDWSLYPCNRKPECTVNLNHTFIKNMEKLKFFAFRNSYKLQSTISEDFFENCKSLETIKMPLIGLRSLPSNLFKNVNKLQMLLLNKNQLTSIGDATFHGLTRLTTLNLESNQLQSLSDHLFRDLRSLKILQLGNNGLVTLGRNTFVSLMKLEELNLHNNNIFFTSKSQPQWENLTNLKVLSLDRNNISISSIPYSWYTVLLELHHLNLSTNAIGPELKLTDLHFLQRDITVDLSNNRIKNIDFKSALNIQFSSTRQRKKAPRISLHGNPFNCDCNSLNLAYFLHGRLQNHHLGDWIQVEVDDVVCAEPKNVAQKFLAKINFPDLYCQFPSLELPDLVCPQYCSCFFIPSLNQTTVDCQKQNLTTMPKFFPMAPMTNQVSLIMRHNKLDDDMWREFDKVVNVTFLSELDLSYNKFKSLDVNKIPTKLTGLSLVANDFSQFDKGELTFLSNLTYLQLGSNPYSCDCSSKYLHRLMVSNPVLVTDFNNVTVNCNGVVKPLLKWKPFELCRNVLFFVLPVLFILVILILIVVILCLYFKKQLSIWIYSHRRLRKLLFMEDLEDKQFDAFISYSNEDSAFVEHQLVPELEGGKDIKYKCLVHIRDFDVGRPIMDQISEAVDNSRRTVIVLSKKFVKSSWYEHEFSAAHSRKRVIVIVLGELPSREEMGDRMWQYINTNTYLEAGDPWFWDKLRYALPHRGRRHKFGSAVLNKKINDEICLIDRRSPVLPQPEVQGQQQGEPNLNFMSSTQSIQNSVAASPNVVNGSSLAFA